MRTSLGNMIRITKEAEIWAVDSTSEPGVARFVGVWGKRPVKSVCSCPAGTRPNPVECKHIKSVMAYKKSRTSRGRRK